MITVLMILFFATLILGVPIFISMALSSFGAILSSGSIALTQLPQSMFSGLNSFTITAIPLFILASDLMTDGSLTDMLIQFCDDMLGRITGGLGHVNVTVSMIFGGISGSAVADAAGPSKLVMYMMRGAGYDAYYSGAVTAASSVIGIIIPPSIPMVLYALSEGKTSILGLFAAGYIPGILVGLSLMSVNYYKSKKNGWKFRQDKLTVKQKLLSLWHALPALVMPIIIIVCTVGGITTPTEASAIAVFYALVVGFIKKTLTIKKLPKLFLGSAIVTSAILMIVSTGSLFAWVLTYARIPHAAATLVATLSNSRIVALLLITVLVMLTGMFVDTIPAIMILAPLVSSIAAQFGIPGYQVAMITVLGIGIGMLTPPVAPLLYITSSIGNLKLEKLVKAVMPCLIAEVAVLLLVIFVPQLSTWLPRILGY